MKKLKSLDFIILIFFLFFVCAKEVQISIIPEEPELNTKPGETGIMTLKVTDKNGKIVKILGISREYPEFVFVFNDNGENGDKNAKDGIWSNEMTVPNDAPPGKYHLDFEAFDSNGNNIIIKTETGEETKIIATIVTNIE